MSQLRSDEDCMTKYNEIKIDKQLNRTPSPSTRSLFRSFLMHPVPLKRKDFSKSIGFILVSHATSQGCLVTLARFMTTSSRASFFGVQLSKCQKYTEKKSHTSSYIYPRLGNSTFAAFDWCHCSFSSRKTIDSIAPSSAPTAPRLLSTATKTPPDVCLRLSLPAISSVILAASAANLHPSLTSLYLTAPPFPPSSICAPSPKRYRTFLSIFSCTFSLYSTSIRWARYTSVLFLLSLHVRSILPFCLLLQISFAFLFELHFFLLALWRPLLFLFWNLQQQRLHLTCLVPTEKWRRTHLPHRPKPCHALGYLTLLLHFFSSSSWRH